MWIFGVPHSTFYPVSNVPVNSGNLMETVNVLTSYVTAKQQQVTCNTSQTDMTAANNTRENISNYLQTNAINNMQHPGMELLVPVQSANNNTSGSQPLANNYMQNNVDILTNNVHADSNESNVLNTL